MTNAWIKKKERLKSLRSLIRADSKNFEAAIALCEALASGTDDLRSGPEVVQAFRGSVLADHSRMPRLAAELKALAELTGELPRAELFDAEFLSALAVANRVSDDDDLRWLCSFLSVNES